MKDEPIGRVSNKRNKRPTMLRHTKADELIVQYLTEKGNQKRDDFFRSKESELLKLLKEAGRGL
jgi:hypothetical protein